MKYNFLIFFYLVIALLIQYLAVKYSIVTTTNLNGQ